MLLKIMRQTIPNTMANDNFIANALLDNNIIELLLNISNNKYKADLLNDIELFGNKLADDLKIKAVDAMTILGYLFERKYIKISPVSGIVINDENPEVQRFLGYIKINS